jgi:hypothetical protein
MKKSQLLVCFLALFGCSLAQTINELASGTAMTGTLLPVLTDYDSDRQANYYKAWIPGNVKSVTVAVQKTDTVCNYINWYVSGSKVPCNSAFSNPTDFSYVCKSAYYNYIGSATTDTEVFVPGDSDSKEVGFASEDWLYITVGKDSAKEDTCTFSVTVTVDLCGAGEVGYYDNSLSTSPYAACSPLTWSLTPTQLPYMANVNLTTKWQQNRVWIPKGTAYVHFQAQNATDYLYIYGNDRHGATDYYYHCYESGGISTDPIDLWCHFPEEGWFYFAFRFYYSFSMGDSIGFVFNVDVKVCDTMSAGYNCSSVLTPVSGLTAGQSITLPAYTSGAGSLMYPAQYFYFDNMNGTSVNANFTVTVTTGSAYLVYRRNGFPGYDSTYYQTSADYTSVSTGSESFALTWEDTWVGGRFYFVVMNTQSTGPVTVTLASASATVSSGSGTTDMSTSTTGAAAAIVAPLFLIALLIAALL